MILRESSYNMTRGGDEDIEGGGSEYFGVPERGALKKLGGGTENLYTLNPKGGGLIKN